MWPVLLSIAIVTSASYAQASILNQHEQIVLGVDIDVAACQTKARHAVSTLSHRLGAIHLT
jgi:hypothetical protein